MKKIGKRMNILTVEALRHSLAPFKHMDNFDKVKELSTDPTMQTIDIFNYGRIIGIREERARRRGQKLDAPILASNFFMEMFEIYHEACKEVPSDILDEVLQEYIARKGEEFSNKTASLLRGFTYMEKRVRGIIV